MLEIIITSLTIMGSAVLLFTGFIVIFFMMVRGQNNFLKECGEELGLNYIKSRHIEGAYQGYALSIKYVVDPVYEYNDMLSIALTCNKPLPGKLDIYTKFYYLVDLSKEKAIHIEDPAFNSAFCTKISNLSLSEVNTILKPDIRCAILGLRRRNGFEIETGDKSIYFKCRRFNNDKYYLKSAIELMVNILKNYREIR